MSDIFQEVEEDLKRDAYQRLWQKYGRYVVIAAVALVVGVAAHTFWRQYQQGQAVERSALYADALDQARDGDVEGALLSLEAQAEDGGGYGILASLQRAKLQAQEGDVAGAAASYDALANDDGIDEQYRQLATLLWALTQVDNGDSAAVLARIEPLTRSDNPFRFSAQEVVALLALRDGDAAAARERYKNLADDAGAPGPLRRRAAEMLAALE